MEEYAANPDGTLLRGDTDSPAWDAVGSMLPSPAPSNQVIDGFLTSRLTGVIAAAATVGELNQVLEDTGVRIVSMTPHNPFVSLVIPAALDVAGAEELAAQLTATDAFAYAYPVREAQNSVIDDPIPGFAPAPASAFTLSASSIPQHLQLTRMQAAWNAKALALKNSSLVTVIVPDHYYSDLPHLQIGAQNFPVFGNLDEVDSPYGNLGFIHTGILGADPDAPGFPGAHPLPEELLQIWSLPVAGLSWVEIANLLGASSLGALISTNFDHLVISSSLDYGDPLFDNVSLAERAMDALAWRLALTGQVATGPAFHLTSAGAAVDQTPAAFASPFALQADNADLLQVVLEFDPGGDPAGLAALQAIWPNLPNEAKSIQGNTAVVGSSTPEGNPSPYSPLLEHLRMPGSSIPGPCVSPNPLCVDGVQLAYGAGAATPQAAALAAYLWNLSPTLSNLGIFNNVVTAFGDNSTPGFADCYAAVLALDPNLLDPRVRKTILDLDENDQFDHVDLALYVAAFDLESTDMRFDLNGDGTVGGEGTAWFDLDANGDNPSYTDVTQNLGCEEKTFNEKGATDRDILVYYAYSELYEGDTDEREQVLGETGTLEVSIDFAETIESEEPSALLVSVTLEGAAVEGAGVSISVTGGSAAASSGQTNASGTFSTTVTWNGNSTSVVVDVTATLPGCSDPGEATASATPPGGSNGVMVSGRDSEINVIASAGYSLEQDGGHTTTVYDRFGFKEFSETTGTFASDTTRAGTGESPGGSMTMSGSATASQTSNVTSSGGNSVEVSFIGNVSGNASLTNPPGGEAQWQSFSAAFSDMDVSIRVFSPSIPFQLNGTIDSSTDLSFRGESVSICYEAGQLCTPESGTINTSGVLVGDPDGGNAYSFYIRVARDVWYADHADPEHTSGSISYSGMANVTLKIGP